jgi:hypothetical protein
VLCSCAAASAARRAASCPAMIHQHGTQQRIRW